MTKHRKPVTAYTYRRYIFLVQLLAEYGDNSTQLETALRFLALRWGVSVVESGHDKILDIPKTIGKLAKACIKHSKEEKQS